MNQDVVEVRREEQWGSPCPAPSLQVAPPLSVPALVAPAVGEAPEVGGADVADAARPGRSRFGGRGLLAVLFVLSMAAGFLAFRSNQIASAWQARETSVAGQNTLLRQRVATAASEILSMNRQITELNGQIITLTGQVGGLQSQVASVANEKEKALDRDTVLSSLLADAKQVASNLTSCVNQTDSYVNDATSAIISGIGVDPSLQSEASNVNLLCDKAGEANAALQSALATNQ